MDNYLKGSGMRDNDKVFDEVVDLIENGLERFGAELKFDPYEEAHPDKANWLIVDASLKIYATDSSIAFCYKDAQAMQDEIIRFVKAVWTPQLLELVRSGEIKNLTLRVGPDTLGGSDLNEENGIENNTS